MKRPAATVNTATKQAKRDSTEPSSAISKSMMEWCVEDVLMWLRMQNFPEHLCSIFSENEIDGEVLVSLSEKDLKEDLGISALGHRRKLVKQRDACLNSSQPQPAQLPVASAPIVVPSEITAKSQKPSVSAGGGSSSHGSESRSGLYPSLPDGPSKRQRLRCEILEVDALQAEFGFGGAVTTNFEGVGHNEHAQGVKVRIRKMLDMAFHPATPEAERSQALRNAQRLMKQHEVNETDVQTQEKTPQGGLFAARLTAVGKGAGIQKEKWMFTLTAAVNALFDTACYTHTRRGKPALYVVFYGSSDAAESAVYAFACASNLMLWMAGSRALPSDQTFTFGAKHRGQKFSAVFSEDKGYVVWAKKTEYEGAAECLQNFIEYVRAQEDPAEWDRAYLEGMAQALKSKTKSDGGSNAESLALHSKGIQDEVLRHFGVKKHASRTDVATAHGLRKSRGSGSCDAVAVNLGQAQIKQPARLAISQ